MEGGGLARASEQRDGGGPQGRRLALPVMATALSCAIALLPLLGCASRSKPREVCVNLEASERLNLYDSTSHPITVYVYPLSSSSAFEQTSVGELLEDVVPQGVVAPPVPITVAPGEKRMFREMFPAETQQLGILADYYRAPNDPEGTRTVVLPARCGMRKPGVILSPRDAYRK